MGVKLTLEIEGPLGPDDANILGGIAMVFLALAQSNSPGEEDAEEETAEPSDMQQVADEWFAANGSDIPQPCGKVDEETGKVCAGLVGHRGRHLFRTMPGMPGVH